MSQTTTATALGWTRNEIANVERQRRRATAAEIVLFARVFKMDPESLWRRILHWDQAPCSAAGFNANAES